MNLPELLTRLTDASESPDVDPNLRHACIEAIRRLRGPAPKSTLKPHRQFHEEIDWASAVKARAGWMCQAPRCLRTHDLQAAHIFRRWHGATKFDEENGIALCGWKHHRWFDEEATPEEAEAFARSIVGDETYDRLRLQASTTLKRVPRRTDA